MPTEALSLKQNARTETLIVCVCVCVCVSKAKASHYVCHSLLETKRAPLPFLSSCKRLSVHNETVEQCIEFLCNCLNYGIFLFIDGWGGE